MCIITYIGIAIICIIIVFGMDMRLLNIYNIQPQVIDLGRVSSSAISSLFFSFKSFLELNYAHANMQNIGAVGNCRTLEF